MDVNKLACLSDSRLHYNAIPQFALIQRMVFINNTSTHVLSYFWEAESDALNKVNLDVYNVYSRVLCAYFIQ